MDHVVVAAGGRHCGADCATKRWIHVDLRHVRRAKSTAGPGNGSTDVTVIVVDRPYLPERIESE